MKKLVPALLLVVPSLAIAQPMKKITFHAYLKSIDDRNAKVVLHEKNYVVPKGALHAMPKAGEVATISLTLDEYLAMKKGTN